MEPWSFQIGSCAMKIWPFYLWSFQIFNTMESRPADFMLWTGDHLYMLKPWQWTSETEMIKAYDAQRKTKPLANFLKSRPQYAIWDDHDYGPNNAGAEFEHKDTARIVFQKMWPQQPQEGQGIYFHFEHKEASFFMLDCRYFKVPNNQLLGQEQTKWLCNALESSKSKFNFVVSSIQVHSDGEFESFRSYDQEYNQLLNFISENEISGVIFLSGDVHFSEASRLDRPDDYPLYDFTFSPLTSFPINYFTKNSYQIDDSKKNRQNFGEIRFSGDTSNRICTIRCISRSNKELWSYEIPEDALRKK